MSGFGKIHIWPNIAKNIHIVLGYQILGVVVPRNDKGLKWWVGRLLLPAASIKRIFRNPCEVAPRVLEPFWSLAMRHVGSRCPWLLLTTTTPEGDGGQCGQVFCNDSNHASHMDFILFCPIQRHARVHQVHLPVHPRLSLSKISSAAIYWFTSHQSCPPPLPTHPPYLPHLQNCAKASSATTCATTYHSAPCHATACNGATRHGTACYNATCKSIIKLHCDSTTCICTV